MEPMLPASGMGELSEISVEIFQKSGELRTLLPSKSARAELARLMREMNSYYSNLIEGHKTLPRDIEKALQGDFSHRPDDRRNQKLSTAHIRAEDAMRQRMLSGDPPNVFSSDFIRWLHHEFYSHVPEEDWTTLSESGKFYPLSPGETRGYNVEVHRHTPPDHAALPVFLQRFESFYSSKDILATNTLIAIAAAHHRLAWIHPFGDGNGRVARLQSQAALVAAKVDCDGLWTLSRGLARERGAYYRHLQEADQGRTSDLDGRGNLSDKGLATFCRFFLTQALDQIEFVLKLIAPETLIARINTYLQIERTDLDPKMRRHLARLLETLCLKTEVGRGELEGILGLKSTATRAVIRTGLSEGLIQSPTEKGSLHIAFPVKVVETYFPKLFTDLPVDRI
jgi:Fic family protein